MLDSSFCRLTHIEINNIRTGSALNKNSLRKYSVIGDKQLQKRNVATLNNAAHIKQEGCVTYVAV